jgi:hypothetical protein
MTKRMRTDRLSNSRTIADFRGYRPATGPMLHLRARGFAPITGVVVPIMDHAAVLAGPLPIREGQARMWMDPQSLHILLDGYQRSATTRAVLDRESRAFPY